MLLLLFCPSLGRGPWKWPHRFYGLCGRSRAVHVAVSDGRFVLEPLWDRVCVVRIRNYVAFRPGGFVGHYSRDGDVDLLALPRGPYPWLGVAARSLSCGALPESRDCLGLATAALRQVGVNAPSRILTPGGLWRWLQQESKG